MIIVTTTGDKTKFILSLNSQAVCQEIFDTTYTGLRVTNQRDSSILTRVDDSSVQFELDSPDSDKEM